MNYACRKLLVIDDDTIVRQSTVAYLEDSGFDVLSAADGPTGLDLFRTESPDLILTDLRMPIMDGLQVLQAVFDVTSDIPVIVISGAGVIGDVVEALRLGASDYLIKPVADMEVLVHSIRKSLERRDLMTENHRYREELEAANRGLKKHLCELERDQLAGRQVQQRLLPPTPVYKAGYQIAQRIVPSLYLSGDCIDYAYVSDRYLAFYLADVSGHGASSAFVTIWLKHLVTRMAQEEGLFSDEDYFQRGPAVVLDRINRELNNSRLSHHMTLFVGVVDTHTNQLNYSVAGHLPMPVLYSEGRAEYLTGVGKPVGIFNDVTWQVYHKELPDSFELACFSDGVLEILPRDKLCDKEQYLLELLGSNGASLEVLTELLKLDSLTEIPDDIALLTLKGAGIIKPDKLTSPSSKLKPLKYSDI